MPEVKTQFQKGRNLSEFLESLRLGEHRPGLGKQRPISTSTLSEAANPTFTISLKEFIFPERNRNVIIALDFGRKSGFSSNAARMLMRAFIGSIAKRTNSRALTSFEKNNDLLSGGVCNSANGLNAAAFASSYPRRSSEADGPRKFVQRSRPAEFRRETQTRRKSFPFSEGAPSGGMSLLQRNSRGEFRRLHPKKKIAHPPRRLKGAHSPTRNSAAAPYFSNRALDARLWRTRWFMLCYTARVVIWKTGTDAPSQNHQTKLVQIACGPAPRMETFVEKHRFSSAAYKPADRPAGSVSALPSAGAETI